MELKDLREVKPIKSNDYTVKQSRLEIADAVPLRSMLISPSTGGKTTLIVHLI